jgi:hypothetical protein
MCVLSSITEEDWPQIDSLFYAESQSGVLPKTVTRNQMDAQAGSSRIPRDHRELRRMKRMSGFSQ